MKSDKIRVTINGKEVEAEPGITVAALIVNQGMTRHSLTSTKRSPLCGMGICFECQAIINGQSLIRTCLVNCREGMEIEYGG